MEISKQYVLRVALLLRLSLIGFYQRNILVGSTGRACLADFGLSRVKLYTTSAGIDKPMLERPPAGTLRWMSPEQITRGELGTSTDVYSFAMTMYEVSQLRWTFTGINV